MKLVISVLLALLVAAPHYSSPSQTFLTAGALQTRDNWRSVRTNNLFVIGNTDSESLRQVAAWLEFFHAAFERLVSRSIAPSSVPTTVVVFRDEASFMPFKPLYQGKPLNLAGYFQAGDDMNYIAIQFDPSERQRDAYSTAFHEYVHLHLRQNVPGVPLWLNEGLAEFYSSMEFSDTEATIGAPIPFYLRLLRAQEMLPLATLFSIDNDSPHYNERDKTGIFYGQSWALVHYLMMGGSGQRQDQFKQFVQYVSRGDRVDKAMESAFGTTVQAIEQELNEYVRRGKFTGQRISVGGSSGAYASYTAMQRSSVTEAEASYYLGDLLLHINRQEEAERYFLKAISLEPNLGPANAALGRLRLHQRRYAEAKKHLQLATTTPQNYLIHYLYAYVLSREGADAATEHIGYSRENVATMREQLLRSIKLAPEFEPAYYLLALVNLLANEQLEEAEALATKGQRLAPSKRSYSLLLAQIHLRRSNAEAARQILEPLTRDSDPAIRADAEEMLASLTGSSTRSSSRSNTKLASSMIVESEPRVTSRVTGPSTGGSAIRDGRTIESSGPMPSVDEVLSRYEQAVGGAKAINAVTSRVASGSLDIVGVSRNGSFEIYSQAPNQTLSVINAHPLGTVKLGFNGKTGWIYNASGLRTLKGLELSALQRDADFYGTVRLKNVFVKVSLLGKSKIGYRDVYVLELEPASGPGEKLFLDSETHLPVRLNAVRSNGGQLTPVEIYYDDWREVDGIKLPFRITHNFSGRALSFTVKQIRQNVPINAELFAPAK